MNCEESKDLMTVGVYGKLTPSEKGRLEAHLRECPGCAGRYKRVKTLNALFLEKENIQLPDREKSWRIIAADVLKRRPFWARPYGLKRPAFGFALGFFLVMAGFVAGFLVHSGWQRNGEMAQLRREVLEIREITAASFLRQESLNSGLRGTRAETLAAPAKEAPVDFILRTLLRDPISRQEFLDSLSEQTSPVVEIALALARNIESL